VKGSVERKSVLLVTSYGSTLASNRNALLGGWRTVLAAYLRNGFLFCVFSSVGHACHAHFFTLVYSPHRRAFALHHSRCLHGASGTSASNMTRPHVASPTRRDRFKASEMSIYHVLYDSASTVVTLKSTPHRSETPSSMQIKICTIH
jgi:hypothetical protein